MRKLILFLMLTLLGQVGFSQVYNYQIQAADILQADNHFVWQGDTIRKDSIVYAEDKVDSIRFHYINGTKTKWYWNKLATKTYINSKVSNEAYANTWNNITLIAPSKDAIYDKISTLEAVNYCAVTMTVSTGTLVQGTVADLCAVGGTDVIIQERVANPPFSVTFGFTGVQRLSGFKIYGRYAGSSTHNVHIEAYNYLTASWDYMGEISTMDIKHWFSYSLNLANSYLSSGEVQVRMVHQDNGNINHQLILDYVNVNFGGGGGSGFVTAGSVEVTPNGNISSTHVQAALQELDTEKEPTLTKGNLTESITGLEFTDTRQVIGGVTTLITSSGYSIPTTASQSVWDSHVTNDGDLSATNEIQAPTKTGNILGLTQTSTTVDLSEYVNPTVLPTPNALTMNNSGAGEASGATFNGSEAKTISYNTVGAAPVSGSGNYIWNGTSPQPTSNFNISGNGVIGGRIGVNAPTPTNGITLHSASEFGGLYIEHSTAFAGNPFEVKSLLNGTRFYVDYGGTVSVGNALNMNNNFIYPAVNTSISGSSNELNLYGAAGINLKTIDEPNAVKILQSGAATFASTIQATTAKLTNLTDGYLPYHISDASGLGNSIIKNAGNNSIIIGEVGGVGLTIKPDDSTTGSVYFDSWYRFAGGGFNFRTATSGTAIDAMKITHNGNVGIGYSTGTEITNNKLAVNGSIFANTGTINTGLTINDGSLYGASDGSATMFFNSIQHIFRRGSQGGYAEQMRLDPSGNLFLGFTSDPASGNKLAVNGGGYFNDPVDATSYKQSTVDLRLSPLRSGFQGTSGTIPVSTGATTDFNWYTVNQAIGGNALSTGYLPYWDGGKLANSPLNWDETVMSLNSTYATFRLNAGINESGGIQFYNQGVQNWNYTTIAGTFDFGLYNNGGAGTGFNMYFEKSTGNVKFSSLATGSTKLVTALADGTLSTTTLSTGANLSTTTSTTTVTVVSDSGTDAVIPAATTGAAGVMTSSDKTKLDGIAEGADNYGSWGVSVDGTTSYQVNSFLNASGKVDFLGGGGIATSYGTSGGRNQVTSTLDIYELTTIVNPTLAGFLPYTTTGTNAKITLTTLKGTIGSTAGTADLLVMRDGSGDAYAHNFILSSDRRLKKNIKPLSNTEWTNKVQFKEFKFKNDPANKTRFGIIAQDIEKIAPELVSVDSEGNKSVAYIDLLIAKIVELEKRIEKLEKK